MILARCSCPYCRRERGIRWALDRALVCACWVAWQVVRMVKAVRL